MITKDEAFRLTRFSFSDIAESAASARDALLRSSVTFSPKVFMPITHNYDPECIYCTGEYVLGDEPHMSLEDVRRLCTRGAEYGASEASFKLSETYDARQSDSYKWLYSLGYANMVDYISDAARIALVELNLLPHINAGTISDREIRTLKEVCISQSLALGSIAGRLSEPGGPNFGIPGKSPARRLATIEAAGRAQVPFSTGLLVGLGDTRHERIEGLLAILELNERYGHIQEIIIQKEASTEDNDELEEEFLWSIAAARLIFGTSIHIQSHPKSRSEVPSIIAAGADDVGGIAIDWQALKENSVPWVNLYSIQQELAQVERTLIPRTSVYPEFISKPGFIAEHLREVIVAQVDSHGYLKASPLSDKNSSNGISAGESMVDIRDDSHTHSQLPQRTSNFPISKISH